MQVSAWFEYKECLILELRDEVVLPISNLLCLFLGGLSFIFYGCSNLIIILFSNTSILTL